MKTSIILAICLFSSITLVSQNNGDVFLAKDSLSQFNFVNETKVYYTLYTKNGSPYILRKTRTFIDNFDIGTEISGLGNYSIKDDTLYISFTPKNNFKDSLSISYPKEKNKQKTIRVIEKHYFSTTPNDTHTVAILENGITHWNFDSNEVSVPIRRNAIPYKIKVWSNATTKEIEIKRNENIIIELFNHEYYSHKYPESSLKLKFPMANLIKRPK